MANGVGIKVTPFATALTVANAGCGGAAAGDRGPGTPVATWTQGSLQQVSWKVTIPHNRNPTDYGVRIAIHYSATDSYAQNVLVANGLPGTTTNEIRTETIQLPAGKISETAVLQWMWASRSDGGFYIGCSDIKISSAIPTAPPTPLAVLPTPAPGPVVTPDDDIHVNEMMRLVGFASDSLSVQQKASLESALLQRMVTVDGGVNGSAANSGITGIRITHVTRVVSESLITHEVAFRLSLTTPQALQNVQTLLWYEKQDPSELSAAFSRQLAADNVGGATAITVTDMADVPDDALPGTVAEEDSLVITLCMLGLALPMVAMVIALGLSPKRLRNLVLNHDGKGGDQS